MWGTARSRVQNMVTGVSEGFTKQLEISGVGYRAAVQGNDSGPAAWLQPRCQSIRSRGDRDQVRKPTAIEVSGADKQKVGQVAAEIRAYRKPEPYKGKGIKYVDEIILRKEGKKK